MTGWTDAARAASLAVREAEAKDHNANGKAVGKETHKAAMKTVSALYYKDHKIVVPPGRIGGKVIGEKGKRITVEHTVLTNFGKETQTQQSSYTLRKNGEFHHDYDFRHYGGR